MKPTPQNIFYIGQGDLWPNIGYQLADKSLVLTGKTAVFTMADAKSGAVIIPRRPALILVETVDPEVGFDWQAGDTDLSGLFKGQFIIDHGSGEETVPNSYYLTILITKALKWPKI